VSTLGWVALRPCGRIETFHHPVRDGFQPGAFHPRRALRRSFTHIVHALPSRRASPLLERPDRDDPRVRNAFVTRLLEDP